MALLLFLVAPPGAAGGPPQSGRGVCLRRARRLEGFTEPWTVAVHKGREMAADLTLAACGLAPAAEVVVVRRVLVPENARPRRMRAPALGHYYQQHSRAALTCAGRPRHHLQTGLRAVCGPTRSLKNPC